MLSLVQIRTRIKDFKNEKLHAFTGRLHKKGITANMVSALSLLLGLIAAYFVFKNSLIYAIFIVLATVLDMLDGALSKHQAQAKRSAFPGWLIDFFCDRTIFLAILISACFYYSFGNIAPTIFIFALVNALILWFRLREGYDPKSVLMFHFVEFLFIFQLFELGLVWLIISCLINCLVVGWQLLFAKLEK